MLRNVTQTILGFSLLILVAFSPEVSQGATIKAQEKVARDFESLCQMPLSGDSIYFRKGNPAYFFSSDAPVAITMTSFPRLILQGKGTIDEILLRIPRARTTYPFEFSLGCGWGGNVGAVRVTGLETVVREKREKYETHDMIFPASRDINSFAMMSFEKDGQIVSLPVRVFSFSNQQFDLSVLYRETETSPWRKFGEVASLPGKALSPEITLSSSGELLVFNKGKELVQFKGPVHVLIPRGIATWQSINLGDNTVLPPGYAGMIRLADVNDLSSRVTIHFSKGDLLIAWGFIAFVHKYGAIGGVALLLLAGAVFFRWRQSKRKPAGGLS